MKLGTSWKQDEKKEEEDKAHERAQKIAVQTIKCRVCGGDHYTAKCPFKDTLGAAAGVTPSGTTPEPTSEGGAGAAGAGKYVPRHLRADANGNVPTREAETTLPH